MRASHDSKPDQFNKVRMGYAVISTKKVSAWQTLLADGIGMQADLRGGNLLCRMDEQACRILVQAGREENLHALGLELADMVSMEEILRRLSSRGVTVRELSGRDVVDRGVSRLWQFVGPKGLLIELYVDPMKSPQAPALKVSGYVTWSFIGRTGCPWEQSFWRPPACDAGCGLLRHIRLI